MWTIACVENTVVISNECAYDLFDEAQSYEGEIWDDCHGVVDKKTGLLQFNPDHMEHMDYLDSHDKVIKILKMYHAEGDICFGSLEGDNAGSFWGYCFDGKGGMKKLKGTIVWKEKPENLKLRGKTVVVTGSLPYLNRQEVEAKIRDAGGKTSNTVSRNTDLLVVGIDPGSKLQKAKILHIKTMNGNDFLTMLEDE